MVRNLYKRKTNRTIWKNNEEMRKAIEEVGAGLSMYAASKKYGINQETLRRHIKKPDIGSVGRPTILTPEC